jgi:hypothetical protein
MMVHSLPERAMRAVPYRLKDIGTGFWRRKLSIRKYTGHCFPFGLKRLSAYVVANKCNQFGRAPAGHPIS